MAPPIINLSGKRFGQLTVIGLSHKDKYGAHWICVCDCGEKITKYGSVLRRGEAKSCGCATRKKLIGKKFGFLVVLSCSGKDKNGHLIWRCKCVCGKDLDILGTNLTRNYTKSCGCKKRSMIESTCLDKYGYKTPFKNKDVIKKTHKTLIKKYGTIHVSQNNEVRKKTKKTCLDRYGVSHPSQNKEIMKKIALAQHSKHTISHWFSKEDVVCTSSYEKKVVEYFNVNKIDYNWQVQTFLMPDGRHYTPDCYLPDQDMWVEIKGYFWGDAGEKWKWFNQEYKNSELWNTEKLKKMRIL